MSVEVRRGPGRPRAIDPDPNRPAAWETETIAREVQEILDALEIEQIESTARLTLQRLLYRKDKYFGGGGAGEITFLLRTIVESEGNGEEALIEPILSAVSSARRPEWTRNGVAWVEAFDRIPLLGILATLRSLFSEDEVRQHLWKCVRRKLWQIFGPDDVARAIKSARGRQRPGRPRRGRMAAQMEEAVGRSAVG